MGDPTNAAELRKTAKDFLHGALWPRRSSVDDIAEEVINLVLGSEANPLTDLINAKYAAYREQSSAAALPSLQNQRSHGSSKLSLKFPRMRNRSASSRECAKDLTGKRQPDAHAASQPDSGPTPEESKAYKELLGVDFGPRPTTSSTSSGQTTKATGSSQITYNCVFCGNDYSVKGTCKRHLEDLHVAKRYYECMKCQYVSRSVPEAKKHMAQCSVGIIDWNTVKPPHRKAYSSEFVATVPFKTQQTYIEHLLDLSALSKDERPRLSWHLKLRNLLDQPEFKSAVSALSKRMFENPEGWREVRWQHERVRHAVYKLEYGLLSRETGPHAKTSPDVVRTFVEDLFADRLSTCASASGPAVQSPNDSVSASSSAVPGSSNAGTPYHPSESLRQAVGGQEMQRVHTSTNPVLGQYYNQSSGKMPELESGAKRPLSYETAVQVPQRQPPGPPAATNYYPSSHHALPTTLEGVPWTQQDYQHSMPATIAPDVPPPYEQTMDLPRTFCHPTGPPLHPPAQPQHHQQQHMLPTPPYPPQLPLVTTGPAGTTADQDDFTHFLLDDTAFLNIFSPTTPMHGVYAGNVTAAGQLPPSINTQNPTQNQYHNHNHSSGNNNNNNNGAVQWQVHPHPQPQSHPHPHPTQGPQLAQGGMHSHNRPLQSWYDSSGAGV
ncbi:hypothetical protein B0A50_04435 [Salinomyces thailandicus]|uniref:C2H2-type domain-containing protein n=1 Tax=Salinomyces thailandicus TaxID=706561 RepID=A0A4U0TYK5_9PEZI|nr:hypothetical protein B0A50_04435 [Salinomyces thailandica]